MAASKMSAIQQQIEAQVKANQKASTALGAKKAPAAAAMTEAQMNAQVLANSANNPANLARVQGTLAAAPAATAQQIAAIQSGSPAAVQQANAVAQQATQQADPGDAAAAQRAQEAAWQAQSDAAGNIDPARQKQEAIWQQEADAAKAAANPAPVVPIHIPTDDEWLAGDSDYQGQLTNANQSLADSLADTQNQRKTYDSTYNDDMRQLGYVQGGGWNTDDPSTQSGRAFSSAANDFASRGMLQSSGYSTALANTTRQFDQQASDAATARTNYMSGEDAVDASQRTSVNTSITQAKQAAIARKAAQYATAASGALS